MFMVQEKTEEEEFSTGPLSVLTMSVKNNTQVCRLCADEVEKKSLVKIGCLYCNIYLGEDIILRHLLCS